MRIAKSTVILLVFVLMLSIFVANVADLINVDTHVLDDGLSSKNARIEWSRPKLYDIGTSFDHLIWFLQVRIFNSEIVNEGNMLHAQCCFQTINIVCRIFSDIGYSHKYISRSVEDYGIKGIL